MEREKKNSSLWQIPVLALLLCFGILIASTGTAFGRYKTSDEGTIVFEMRGPAKIYIGTVSEDEFAPFADGETVEWVSEGDKATLKIAVSNGTHSDEDSIKRAEFSEEDLRLRIRFISDLGLTEGVETTDSEEGIPIPAEVTLTVKPKGLDEGIEKKASAERILSGSTLFFQKGDGWIYSFLDEDGKEIGWELEGGKLSWIELTVEVDTSKISAQALDIQPRIIVEKTG